MGDPGLPPCGDANSPGRVPTHDFAKCSWKLHGIERICIPGGACPGPTPQMLQCYGLVRFREMFSGCNYFHLMRQYGYILLFIRGFFGGGGSYTDRILIKLLTIFRFFFQYFLISNEKVWKSKLCIWWRIQHLHINYESQTFKITTVSQQKIEIFGALKLYLSATSNYKLFLLLLSSFDCNHCEIRFSPLCVLN